MSKKLLKHCCSELKKAWPILEKQFKQQWPGHTLRITSSHRPPEEQFKLYQKGRRLAAVEHWIITNPAKVVTNLDGFKKKSKHNYYPSKALDFVIINSGGDALWLGAKPFQARKKAEALLYLNIHDIAKELSLTTGYWWNAPFDPYHLQI